MSTTAVVLARAFPASPVCCFAGAEPLGPCALISAADGGVVKEGAAAGDAAGAAGAAAAGAGAAAAGAAAGSA